jgi:hypothetical protein
MPRYVVGICEEHLTDFEYDVQAASAEEARSKTERALPGTLAIYGVGESLVLSRTVMWCDPYRPSRDDRDAPRTRFIPGCRRATRSIATSQ